MAEGTGGEIVAEFQEVMRQWNRICNIIDKTKYICSDSENGYICPMRNNGLCNKSISAQTDSDWKDGEKMIMSWAAEHPEPVYPTWGEFFVKIGGLAKKWKNATNPAWEANMAIGMFRAPIPADIAQKLGIEPKEDA
jgi:hypothetical protein